MTSSEADHEMRRWFRSLAVVVVFTQRLAVPGTPVPLLVPIVIAFVAVGLRRGFLRVSGRRLKRLLIFAGVSGLLVCVQNVLVDQPLVSILSLALVLATWFPFLFVTNRKSRESDFNAALKIWVNTNLVLSALCVSMTLSQLLGIKYTDIVGSLVPKSFLMPGYITTYPIYFGSEIYRSNGWVGLEASIVAFDLGIAVVSALIIKQPPWKVLVLVAAMLCTSAGSGYLIVIIGVAVMVFTRQIALLRPYLYFAVPTVFILLLTTYGRRIFERTSEFSSSTSSTSLRTVQAYVELVPRWLNDPTVFLVGKGSGSSQQIITGLGQDGLQASTLAKILFEYGLIGGAAFLLFVKDCYSRGHSMALAGAMLFSLFTVQPGLTVMALLAPVYVLVGLWARPVSPPLYLDSHTTMLQNQSKERTR